MNNKIQTNFRRLLPLWVLLWWLVPAAHAQDYKKINKEHLVVKEWKTSVKTGKKFLDHITTFNAAGKKVEEIEYDQTGQQWRKRYEYGGNGKCTKEFSYNEHNQLVGYKTYEYNEYGRKKVQQSYDSKGKLKSVKHFEYIVSDDK